MSKAKKMLASFLLVSLVAVSFYQIFYPCGLASTVQGAASSNSGFGSQQYAGYDPYASPRPVTETVIGYDMGGGSGKTVSLPSPGTSDLQVTMKNGWSGKRVTTSIANLWDQKNWLPGGTFDTGSNTPHGTNRSASDGMTLTKQVVPMLPPTKPAMTSLASTLRLLCHGNISISKADTNHDTTIQGNMQPGMKLSLFRGELCSQQICPWPIILILKQRCFRLIVLPSLLK